MWFEKLTGFKESPENVRANLKVEGDTFISLVNNKRFKFGKLDIVTLESLRKESSPRDVFKDKIKIKEVVADVQILHQQPENYNAIFQAASQFNLLEMIGPHITPEQGIDRYESDKTQGPACAIACGAGTIYRNYFVPVRSQIGQTKDNQIDCLDLIGIELQNEDLNLWAMNNGYALANQEGIQTINRKLTALTDSEREELKGKLKVGIQWDTEVTITNDNQTVTQVYCSALPVAYSHIESYYWESFARVILEASYEATLYAAIQNLEKSNIVYLTLVGGGAFGNDIDWILDSLKKALLKFRNVPLDIRIVSYGSSNERLVQFINEFNKNN